MALLDELAVADPNRARGKPSGESDDERPADLSLYLVTDTRLCGEFGVAATVAAAVAAGVTVVQLRDPDADDEDFVTLGRAVVAVLAGTGVPLIVNDRVHLVAAIGADGVHVGQGDLDPGFARRMIGPMRCWGFRCRPWSTCGPPTTWAGVSSTTSGSARSGRRRPSRTPPSRRVDAGCETIVDASPWPCVAIGGVDAERAPSVRAAGAAGVAVVSAICGRPDVAAATRRIRQAWDFVAGQSARG